MELRLSLNQNCELRQEPKLEQKLERQPDNYILTLVPENKNLEDHKKELIEKLTRRYSFCIHYVQGLHLSNDNNQQLIELLKERNYIDLITKKWCRKDSGEYADILIGKVRPSLQDNIHSSKHIIEKRRMYIPPSDIEETGIFMQIVDTNIKFSAVDVYGLPENPPINWHLEKEGKIIASNLTQEQRTGLEVGVCLATALEENIDKNILEQLNPKLIKQYISSKYNHLNRHAKLNKEKPEGNFFFTF